MMIPKQCLERSLVPYYHLQVSRIRFSLMLGTLLGDAGYRLLNHLMIPYKITQNMPDDESNYNYLHNRTSIVAEYALGIWKNRFQIFRAPLRKQSPEYMTGLIEATMILHNWLIDLEDLQDNVELEPWMLIGVPPGVESVRDNDEIAKRLRDNLKDYLFNL